MPDKTSGFGIPSPRLLLWNRIARNNAAQSRNTNQWFYGCQRIVSRMSHFDLHRVELRAARTCTAQTATSGEQLVFIFARNDEFSIGMTIDLMT
jgi:hypothetical protein